MAGPNGWPVTTVLIRTTDLLLVSPSVGTYSRRLNLLLRERKFVLSWEAGVIPARYRRCDGDVSLVVSLAESAGKKRGAGEPESEDRSTGFLRATLGFGSRQIVRQPV